MPLVFTCTKRKFGILTKERKNKLNNVEKEKIETACSSIGFMHTVTKEESLNTTTKSIKIYYIPIPSL